MPSPLDTLFIACLALAVAVTIISLTDGDL
jgi:hypothetical protein